MSVFVQVSVSRSGTIQNNIYAYVFVLKEREGYGWIKLKDVDEYIYNDSLTLDIVTAERYAGYFLWSCIDSQYIFVTNVPVSVYRWLANKYDFYQGLC